ncbi:MAG: hypothetical protein RR590_04840 [Hungatella sp.]
MVIWVRGDGYLYTRPMEEEQREEKKQPEMSILITNYQKNDILDEMDGL